MHILSLKPELILYFYMAGCLAVLAFNLIYIIVDKMQKAQQKHRHLNLADVISGQMRMCETCGYVKERHQRMLKRKLSRARGLKVFEESLEKVRSEVSAETFELYVRKLRGVFLFLVQIYQKRDMIEKSYFCSILEKFPINVHRRGRDPIIEFLLSLTVQREVYARENALKALYRAGNQEAVLSALIRMSEFETNHNSKLLSDGLLDFNGNRERLARLLWENRRRLNTHMRLAVMQFIRYASGDFQQEFLEVLKADTQDKELRLEAIRYLRRYPYEPAREIIQNFIRYQEFIDWEYAAMAAAALSVYPGEDTIGCLKEGLSAINWYVRLNCAEALIDGLGLAQLQLFDIYNGQDRYAREILQYALKKSQIMGQEMELGVEHV